jgi:hypothetical protein
MKYEGGPKRKAGVWSHFDVVSSTQIRPCGVGLFVTSSGVAGSLENGGEPGCTGNPRLLESSLKFVS